MIGQTLSHNRILEELGEDGMGVVYKAEDTKGKKQVLIQQAGTECWIDSKALSAEDRFSMRSAHLEVGGTR